MTRRTLNRPWPIRPGWAMTGARCGGFPTVLGQRSRGKDGQGAGAAGAGSRALGVLGSCFVAAKTETCKYILTSRTVI